MKRPHILVSEHLGATALKILEAEAEVEAYDLLPEADFRKRLADADAVIIRSAHKVRREHLDLAPRLKVVARAGAGVDNIDIPAATTRGVLVVNTPGANAVAAAEHTIGLMIAVMRHIPAADQHVRGGQWNRQAFFGYELKGRRLGIIGIGRVGSRVAQRARAFGMTVYAYDPYLSHAVIRERGAEPVDSLEALLPLSDVLTIHTPKTGPRLGLDDLKRLPQGAIVMNVARGGLIDEDALAELLQSGHVWGAGLDVFAEEPPRLDHPLFRLPRVVVTCHLGGSTREAQNAIGERVARSVLDALAGRVPAGAVNLPGVEAVQDPGPIVTLGRLAGELLAFSDAAGRTLHVASQGLPAEEARHLLVRATATGYLEAAGEEDVNLVSALALAEARGMTVRHEDPVADGGDTFAVRAWFDDPGQAVGLTYNGGLRLRQFWGAHFDTALAPWVLVTRHHDRPGMVGALGTIVGEAGVNIATLELSRHRPGDEAVMILALDSALDGQVLDRIRQLPGLRRAELVELPALQDAARGAAEAV
jgi:D-3-phosphoglycerate dehydrogenase